MSDDPTTAGRVVPIVVVAWTAAVIGTLSSVLLDFARLQDGHLLGNTLDLVRIGSSRAAVFRWSSLLDMLGNYLLFIPLALYVRSRAGDEQRTAADIGAAAALVYAGVGAAAAAAWAASASLVSSYAAAAPSDRPHIALIFATVTHIVAALWHSVVGPAGALWLGTVWLVERHRWRGFAVYSGLFAIGVLLGSIGSTLLFDASSTVPATVLFLPFAVWAAWLAIEIERERRKRL